MRRATGPRPIGEILPGDQVWAYRFEAGSWELCEVKERLDNTYSGPVISITVDSTTIEATAYHPFWVIEGRDLQERSRPRELQEHEDEGHSLPGRWVNSHELRAGDWIITRSGTRALITEIRQHFEPAFPVSNLTIFGHHNYSVGDVGVLVHNVSVCDGTIADLRKLRADGMSEDKINDWLRGKTDDNGNRLYNDDEIEKALGRILAPNTARRAPAPDNYRGRFNAERQAQGRPRLPDDYDAHHRIPQEYMDHPEFRGYDFHQPNNIQGVKGSRADVNTHQLITNEWADFRRLNPNATRAQIEAFAAQIDARYAQHWFQ